MKFLVAAPLAGLLFVAALSSARAAAPALEPLAVRGEHFVTPDGKPFRFWGVNLVACYPTAEQAAPLAQRLADLGVNLARPHHYLRPSKDWVRDLPSGALLAYTDNATDFEPEALDRFDRLNAELRHRGIRLALSFHGTRNFHPGDVDLLDDGPEGRAAWLAALDEMAKWSRQKQFDVLKALPVVDERAALASERFARALLTHVNPHTGLSYAEDPQVAYWEVLNEHSLEYAVVCGNRFPGVIEERLVERWNAYVAEHGGGEAPTDLFKPATPRQRELRSAFLMGWDRAYFERMKRVLAGSGSKAAVVYSNLWRGESVSKMNDDLADLVEDHIYADPFVASEAGDFVNTMARSALAGKPFVIGEINQSEPTARQLREAPYRSQLLLAAAAYGAFQDWSGLVWFSWTHGAKEIDADGWGLLERRVPSLGIMANDAMMIDHLRTAGMIFREGLVARARKTVSLPVAVPFWAGDYNALMRPQNQFRAGWANVHALRKTFGPGDPGDVLAQNPPAPLASDTGEIVKDTARKQLTVSAPRVEAFSGLLDDAPPAGLPRLAFAEPANGGFATVIAVVADGDNWEQARRLIVSQTWMDPDGKETVGSALRLKGLPAMGAWNVTLTRNRVTAGDLAAFVGTPTVVVRPDAAGVLTLPRGWKECEITVAADPGR